jgi:hypothetical protein
MGGAAIGENSKKQTQARRDQEKDLAAILDRSQFTRLLQIELQLTRKQGLGTLLRLPRVEKELALTGEQIQQIDRIHDDEPRIQRLLTRELYYAADGRPDKGFRKSLEAFHKCVDRQLNAVLTPRQQDTLKTLLGEPFEADPGHARHAGPG